MKKGLNSEETNLNKKRKKERKKPKKQLNRYYWHFKSTEHVVHMYLHSYFYNTVTLVDEK